MKTLEIKSINGAVLFTAAAAGIREVVEQAVMAGVSLARANLVGANFYGANLSYANLSDANLSSADLHDANLSGANLSGANLAGAIIQPGITAKTAPVQVTGLSWPVRIWDEHMQVGCKLHSHAEWAAFSDEEIAEMAQGAAEFWAAYRSALLDFCMQHAPGD